MKDVAGLRDYDPRKRWRDSQAGVVRAWKFASRIGGGLLATLIVGSEVRRSLTYPFSTLNPNNSVGLCATRKAQLKLVLYTPVRLGGRPFFSFAFRKLTVESRSPTSCNYQTPRTRIAVKADEGNQRSANQTERL
jgi:hypothetical protein